MKINNSLTLENLRPKIDRFFNLAGPKILDLENTWDPAQGTPVFTVQGKYTSRGWTEWTQGFQYGSALLQFDATDESTFLKIGMEGTRELSLIHI